MKVPGVAFAACGLEEEKMEKYTIQITDNSNNQVMADWTFNTYKDNVFFAYRQFIDAIIEGSTWKKSEEDESVGGAPARGAD